MTRLINPCRVHENASSREINQRAAVHVGWIQEVLKPAAEMKREEKQF